MERKKNKSNRLPQDMQDFILVLGNLSTDLRLSAEFPTGSRLAFFH